MKNLTALLTVILLSILTAANAETFRIPVSEFSELTLDDNINVIYSANPDSVGYVVFDTKPEFASYVMTDNSKGHLRIQVAQEADGLDGLPTVYAYSSFLSKIKNTKDSTLIVRNIKPAPKIEVELQGNGKIITDSIDATNVELKLLTGKGTIVASGRCGNLNVKVIGTGVVQADGLKAKDVKCHITGTGTLGCSASGKLNVSGLGSGKVYYKGKPEVSLSKLGKLQVIPLDEPKQEEDPDTVQ